MPKFDMDKLFDYLIVIMIVGGSVLGPMTKKLIEIFSPKPPEPPKPPARSGVNQPEGRKVTVRPVTPVRPPSVPPTVTTRPASRAAVGTSRSQSPAVDQHGPVARRIVTGEAGAAASPRQARSPEDASRTLEAMVEAHLRPLLPTTAKEAERVERGVERRLKPVETHVAPLQGKRRRAVARKPVTGSALESPHVRRLTRQGLRQAILLREILGPPIALRTPDDPW